MVPSLDERRSITYWGSGNGDPRGWRRSRIVLLRWKLGVCTLLDGEDGVMNGQYSYISDYGSFYTGG